MGNRDLAAAWAYHDGTKHSGASVSRSRHMLEWDIMPRPFKVYPRLDPIPLPRDLAGSQRPALTAIADPGSATSGPPLDLATLARLFYFGAGVLRRRRSPSGETFFRAAACTGNLHHIDLYLICGPLPPVTRAGEMTSPGHDAGVYHFGAHDFALRRLRAGDYRAAVLAASGHESTVAAAPAILACTSTFWRNAWKYQARTYRHCFWDSGTVLANLLAVAAAIGLPARVVLGFVDDEVNCLFGLDTEREVTLCLVALGSGAPPPPPAPAVAPLTVETLPLSARAVDYPAIREIHAASSLLSRAEVVAWRQPLPRVPVATAHGPLIPLADPAPTTARESIEAVILRRGSTRAFGDEAIGFDVLSALLRSATRGIPADFLAGGASAAELYLIVNAVEGLAPGVYVFDRESDGLTLLRPGNFRRDAGDLALGQALAAEAAVDIFWLTDLRPILERFGNRGYRAAQLAAAIGGGKVYLAAFALGIGATGLTFFDDDVTAFFSPPAAGKSVMFLMACGVAERQRKE